MHDLEQIKQDNPLTELVIQETGQTGRRSGHWTLFHCPLPHHADSTPSFGIDDKERFCCFGCNKEGDLFDYLELTRGWDLQRSVEYFGGREMSDEEQLERTIRRGEIQKERLEAEIERTKNALAELREARMWVKYEQNLSQSPSHREMWCDEGIPGWWQEEYHLGYAPNFYEGESLVIPVFTPFDNEPVNIRHRIIGRTGDKYRPEKAGLPASFYWAFPALGATPDIFLVEGEKKAMVLRRYLSEAGANSIQVVGFMGKNGLKAELVPQIANTEHVYYIPDPNVERELIWKHIQTLGIITTIIQLPRKVDDMLVSGKLDGRNVIELTNTGVTVDV